LIVVLLVFMTPYCLCEHIQQVFILEPFWFRRFYLKIRLTKILHYEVFKVQRTFPLPGFPVCFPVLRSVFVVTEHLISYHRTLKLSTTFRVFFKLFSPFYFGICTPSVLLFYFTVLRQLYYIITLLAKCQ